MEVLVDTSIWIDYFRGGNYSHALDYLLEEGLVVTNEIILAELLPYIKIKKQNKLARLLNEIKLYPLDINWNGIINFQIRCLKGGSNGIGIPDLIIVQNAKQNRCPVYSIDKHFRMMSNLLNVKLFQ